MNRVNLAVLPVQNVEEKLVLMKQLRDEIKEKQAYFDMLKEEVIADHFANNEEYKTSKGLLLASYKSYTEKRFNGKKFQEDFQDIYENYKEENTVTKFLLK